MVAVDARGRHLRPTIVWMDRRAEAQSRALGGRIPAVRIFDITGLNLDSSHVAPKILWLRDEEPEAYRDASAFLLPGSYLVHRLTGEMVVDYSNASSTMLYDVRSKTGPRRCSRPPTSTRCCSAGWPRRTRWPASLPKMRPGRWGSSPARR